MFNIDINTIIRQILPPFKRSQSILEYLRAAVHPLIELHQNFLEQRQKTLEYLAYNSQVIYLERLLNQVFNNGNTGIYISDAVQFDYWFLYNNAEQHPQYLYNTSENQPVFLYNEQEFDTNYDFIVWVPTAVTFNINRMRALINRYKLAGKRYDIQTY